MKKIYYRLDIGYCGCNDEGYIEVDDDMTGPEIDGLVYDMAFEYAQSWEGDERLAWDSEMSEEEYEEATESFYQNVWGNWRFATEEDL